MDRQKALSRLRKERDYEEGLVQRLNDYILHRIYDLKDLSEEERETIHKSLQIITHDSIRHAYLFSDLMQTVIEDDKEGQY